MKINIYIMFVSLALVFSCKKKEETKEEPAVLVESDKVLPVLTLLGKTNDTIILQSNYVESGAKAIDNKDGDISPFVVISGSVNANLRGDYSKEYNVRDAAGNSAVKATRLINVKNTIQDLEGNYAMTCKCYSLSAGSSTLLSTTNHTSTVIASYSLNNVFDNTNVFNGTLNKPFNLRAEGFNIIGTYFEGGISGTISPSKNSFTITIETYDQHSPNSVECKNVYIKQ